MRCCTHNNGSIILLQQQKGFLVLPLRFWVSRLGILVCEYCDNQQWTSRALKQPLHYHYSTWQCVMFSHMSVKLWCTSGSLTITRKVYLSRAHSEQLNTILQRLMNKVANLAWKQASEFKQHNIAQRITVDKHFITSALACSNHVLSK